MAETWKCLTLWQPWADLVIFGDKRVENRTWSTGYIGPMLVHAGLGFDGGYEELTKRQKKQRKHIIGIVDIVGYDYKLKTPWDQSNQEHWRLGNPRAFENPIRFIGRQGLFVINSETYADVIAAIEREVRNARAA